MRIPGYRVERAIAKGGMASVYLASQKSLGRRVALKLLRKFDDGGEARRFLHEGRVIAALDHRHVITIHNIGKVGERYYISMEYLEGGSLGERIRLGMQPAKILDLLEQVANCLAYIHRQGIVHRDVKPGNILFHADGSMRLTDFGIAKQLGNNQELTQTGFALGSPYYLSPEQAMGRPLDGRSDIYSLGVVFYEMLTQKRPFDEDSHVETIVARLHKPLPVLPEPFRAYQSLLDHMLAKDPEERYSSAEDLLDAIRQVRQQVSEESSARARRGSRRLLPVAAVAGLAVGLLAVAGWSAFEQNIFSVNAPAEFVEQRTAPESAISGAGVPAFPVSTSQALEPATAATVPPATPNPVVGLEQESDPTGKQADIIASLPEKGSAVDSLPDELPEPPALSLQPATDDQQKISNWLSAAKTAMRANRLTVPSNDNARYYYHRILALEPAHSEALTGLQRVGDQYAGMARRAHKRGRTKQANRYITRGLNAIPKHQGLLALREEIKSAQKAPVKVTTERPKPEKITLEQLRNQQGSGDIVNDMNKVWRALFD